MSTNGQVDGAILKKNNTAIVYERPIVEEGPEGEFVLWGCSKIDKFNNLGFQIETWQGHFYGEPDRIHERRIMVRLPTKVSPGGDENVFSQTEKKNS